MLHIFAAAAILIASLFVVDCTFITPENVRAIEMIEHSKRQMQDLDDPRYHEPHCR
jgi:hypothetical protein